MFDVATWYANIYNILVYSYIIYWNKLSAAHDGAQYELDLNRKWLNYHVFSDVTIRAVRDMMMWSIALMKLVLVASFSTPRANSVRNYTTHVIDSEKTNEFALEKSLFICVITIRLLQFIARQMILVAINPFSLLLCMCTPDIAHSTIQLKQWRTTSFSICFHFVCCFCFLVLNFFRRRELSLSMSCRV